MQQDVSLKGLYSRLQAGDNFGMTLIKPGTYCFEKISPQGNITTTSATFINDEPRKYELNIICKQTSDLYKATFGFKKYNRSSKKYEEIYRIDFSSKHGWHIDSAIYHLEHVQLRGINNWEEILGKIRQHLELLPLTIKEIVLKFTDPEETFDLL